MKTKKLLTVLMVTVMMFTCIPVGTIPVAAATSGTTGDCTWTLDGTHLTISGTGAIPYFNLLSRPWGRDITTVTIENGVTAISMFAFLDCSTLTSVTIPSTVTTIGDGAFQSCSNLVEVILGEGVTTIGAWAFSECESLSSINIPNSVTSIEGYAFTYCFSLTSITLGSGVSWVAPNAFTCINMSSIDVVEENPYYSSTDGVLFNKDKTTLVAYPIAKAGTYTIPNSVTSIDDYAFDCCENLTSVTIGDNVTSIGEGAFGYCSSLTEVYYNGTLQDKNKITILDGNETLTSAMWHYFSGAYDATCNECGAVREVSISTKFGGNSISEDVSGLAFRFDLKVEGMTVNGTIAIYDSATKGGYKVLSMGAVVTNGISELDIPAVYLCDLELDSAGFAVRIKNIPTDKYDVAITATPYIILEIDGVATTIYGTAQTGAYADVAV